MEHEFAKCEHCGTWHIIKVVPGYPRTCWFLSVIQTKTMPPCTNCKFRPKVSGNSRCLQCAAEYVRERYQNNSRVREQTLARVKRHHKEHGRERRAYNNRWAKEHLEQHRKRCRKNSHTYRARKLGQFIEDVDPRTVYAMHGGCCGICKQFVSEDDFHVDHVVPLSKGGLHGYVNVQPAHPHCNLVKGAQ